MRQIALLASNVVFLDRDWKGVRECEVLFCPMQWIHRNKVTDKKSENKLERIELGFLQSVTTPEDDLNIVDTTHKIAKTRLKSTGTEEWLREVIIFKIIDFKILVRGW